MQPPSPRALQHYVLTLISPDRPGIVRAIAAGIGHAEGNITESAQFSDPVTGLFSMRVEFESQLTDLVAVHRAVEVDVAGLDATLGVRPRDRRRRCLILVSKADHCLMDLLYRYERGELPVEIPVVVGNHDVLRPMVEAHGIEFVHVPVTPETKPAAEARIFELVEQHDVDFVVLARYMQVLSDDACARLHGRAINIHHSFLPGFKGARPYHQAHERGVKLIGATAHYVTAELDEGPIIEQEVVRVNHARTPEEMVALGRDVERLALARAVEAHAEDRVFLCGHRTVVFHP
jgi:formyltetrahydrofolate deformylase